jgi:homogentisate 1,2-dioxygenase
MHPEKLTHARIAENQSTFREANDRIEAAAHRAVFLDPVPFICECADTECLEVVRIPLAEYEEMRMHPRRFFNAPGHEALSVESGAGEVVARRPGYVLVDKIAAAGEIAAQRYEELEHE